MGSETIRRRETLNMVIFVHLLQELKRQNNVAPVNRLHFLSNTHGGPCAKVPIMSLRDSRRATQAEETDDVFPVRDIETNSSNAYILPSKLQLLRINNKPGKNDTYLDFEEMSIPEMSRKLYDLICIWYKEACYEANYVIHDVKKSWIATTGNYTKKTQVISRLLMFYSIILALYVIKSCLWINQTLLQGLYITLIKSKKNTQMLIGLGIVFSLIVMAYVIGAPYCPELATSTDP
ncbi:uncharacterized protein LOC122503794 isoform X2 [Leptopilina heterotoma]|uniref:uncharacterized protein LOC122503794 isoform X2 n=1 Tax=Leptopilina heterotoma TaxID=63436 RepID=UPI001CA84AEE|nr:uncharacterized protein LOC122503794 isoform X2 [Leptopilina heterotoma]